MPARRSKKSNRKRLDREPLVLPSLSAAVKGFAKRIAKHRRTVLLVALAGASIAMLVTGATWMLNSSRFSISQVHAEPRQFMPDRSFHDRIGLESEANIFRFDVASAAARLEASPWVRSAKVKRQFPRGLSVELEENIPAAVALIDDLYLVDAKGIAFKRTSSREAGGLDLLVLTGLDRESLRLRPSESQARMAVAISIAEKWNTGSQRPRLVEIHCDAVRGFSLVPEGGTPVIRLGQPHARVSAKFATSSLESRFALFDRLWTQLTFAERDQAESIHLDQASDPSRAAVAFTQKRVEPWAE